MTSNCPHIGSLGNFTQEEIHQLGSKCDACGSKGPYLWVCMHKNCLFVGCSDAEVDHSSQHFKNNSSHCLALNLGSYRMWCYICETEVFIDNNIPQPCNSSQQLSGASTSVPSVADSDEEEFEDENVKPRGLTGLQNIGNTCYMNAAIQALSNCPPLTRFFLDCSSFVRSEKRPGLSKSFTKLMMEMWHTKRPSYVVPSSIAHGIKMVCPMFRGYTQQDSQEFLRCFMDQLHEELKEPVPEIEYNRPAAGGGELRQLVDDVSMESGDDSTSQSESEYETCPSGLSSEKSSLSDDSGGADQTSDVLGLLKSRRLSLREVSASDRVRKNALKKRGIGGHRGGDNIPIPPTANHLDQAKEIGWNHQPDSACLRFSISEDSSPSMETETDSFNNVTADVVPTSASSRSCSPTTATDSRLQGGMITHHGDKSATPSNHGNVKPNTLHTYPKHLNSVFANKSGAGNVTPLQGKCQMPLPSSLQSSQPTKSSRKRKQMKYRSIISDVFDGKILSSVQCLTCDRVSSTKETFQDLSLPIPSREYLSMLHASQGCPQKGPLSISTCTDVYTNQGWITWMISMVRSWLWGPMVSLHDCLAAFFSADELKGDNMYSCEKCKKLRNGIKYSKVLHLPEILCVHLKRFRHEVMFSSKISNYVSFPLEDLDMKPYLYKDCSAQVTSYDLVAVICHHGTAGGGHYTTYALNYVADQWYEFDDQFVTEVDPQTVANCEAYVLFYRKMSEESSRKRLRTVELLEICKKDPGLMQFYVSKQWINKFNTFVNPGPIDNTDFLCPHGGVSPLKMKYCEELCIALSQSIWEYLYESYGGGPACNRLHVCPICQQEKDLLEQRQKQELETFKQLNNDFQAEESSGVIYAISMSWFRQWEKFALGKDDPPGPIDNSSICQTKNGQVVLKMGSDYAQLSEPMWQYLHGIHGGGPELVPRKNSIGSYGGGMANNGAVPTATAPAPSSSPCSVHVAGKQVSRNNSPVADMQHDGLEKRFEASCLQEKGAGDNARLEGPVSELKQDG